MEKSSTKRSSTGDEGLLDGIKAVVLEVDGAVISPKFFLDTLVKYVSDNAAAYIKDNFSSESLTKIIDELRKQAADDVAAGKEGAVLIPAAAGEEEEAAVVAAAATNVQFQMRSCANRSSSGELMFAEMIAAAYKAGEIKGKVYDDAAAAIKQLSAAGNVKLYAYADYCSDTAKLTMQHSTTGDLSSMFAEYYDYRLCTLKDKANFQTLADKLKVKVKELLYVSHKSVEVCAANAAGAKGCLIERSCAASEHEEHNKKPACPDADEKGEAGASDLGGATVLKCLTELVGEPVHSPTKKMRGSEAEEGSGGTKVCVETGCEDKTE